MSVEESTASARKSAANKRAYAKSKASRDHVLLRLDAGDASFLDMASHAAGLSRSAFARLFLPALMAAVSSRLPSINDALSKSGESFGQFVGRALDRAIEGAEMGHATMPDAASEFDSLFGTDSGQGGS